MVVRNSTPLNALDAVVIDTETTGLDPAEARIVEFAAIRILGGRLSDEMFRSLVSPGVSIPAAATAIHHIDDAKVAGAPSFSQAWPELINFIGGAVVIGHTIGFDLAVLERECKRAGVVFRQPRALDTRILAEIIEPTLAEYTIESLASWLGVQPTARHSAKGDAITTARIFADFAKLVELFDAHGVSFVSVTQQFNTTTSMGRLTLNVLLSFAQFEREVTSERIRDKIGASKRKGLWVGGVVPLGYQAKNRKITVVADEAKTVRHIFRRYLDLGSLNLVLTDLRRSGVKTKLRPLSNGRTIGGIPFTRGSLAAFLRNRFYIGEVRYKGEVFPGEQPAILDRALFEAVQTKLDQQRTNHAKGRQKSQSLLTGRIFDARGNRMTPSHAAKNGVRYRHYISSVLIQGQADKAATLNRVPAAEIETLIISVLRKHLKVHTNNKLEAHGSRSPSDQDLISTHIARVDVKPDHLAVRLSVKPSQRSGERHQALSREGGTLDHSDPNIMLVPWRKTPSKRPREIILPAGTSSHLESRPIRSETRLRLVTAIAKGRRWLDAMVAGTATNVEQIASAENCTVRQINMTISLAFLAPNLVQAAVDGRLPRGVGIANLRDAPTEWSLQYARLGLAS